MSNIVPIRKDDWVVVSSGDWAEDCVNGRKRADALVLRMSQDMSLCPQFLRTMRGIVEKQQFSGVEIGFCQRLLELAILGRAYQDLTGRQ